MTKSNPDDSKQEVDSERLKKALMRKKARELADEIEEFEDEYGDVLSISGQHSWYEAYSGMKKISRER